MSVGYDLAGIRHPRMTRFMDRDGRRVRAARDDPHDAPPRLPAVRRPRDPRGASSTASRSRRCTGARRTRSSGLRATASRSAGCTRSSSSIPRCSGRTWCSPILHDQLGFREIRIPDAVFDHDLQYGRAVALIRTLKETAARCGLTFGVKLSNTLAMANHAGRLPGGEMYMSGRALYPVTMRLYDRLLHEFGGDLHVSYSGRRRRGERRDRARVRRAAGHRMHRPAQAGRRRAHDAVARARRGGDA